MQDDTEGPKERAAAIEFPVTIVAEQQHEGLTMVTFRDAAGQVFCGYDFAASR